MEYAWSPALECHEEQEHYGYQREEKRRRQPRSLDTNKHYILSQLVLYQLRVRPKPYVVGNKVVQCSCKVPRGKG